MHVQGGLSNQFCPSVSIFKHLWGEPRNRAMMSPRMQDMYILLSCCWQLDCTTICYQLVQSVLKMGQGGEGWDRGGGWVHSSG